VVRGFVKDGVDPTRIVEFGKAAQDLADVLGIKVVDAAQQVGEAFTGGYDSVKKLDDATNFLTSAQRDNIKSLFDQGKAADARNEALRIFSDQQEDAANKMRGSWSEAARSLGGAWQDFLNVLSDTAPIKEIAKELEGLGRIASQAIRAIAGAKSAGDISAQIARANTVIGAKAAQPNLAAAYEADIVKIRKQVAGWQAELDKLNGTQKQVNDTVAVRSELQKKQTVDLVTATDAAKSEKTVLEATNEARRSATEYVEKNFKFASEAAKQAYIGQKAEEARTAALKKAADERKREANEAKRVADEAKRERERLAKQTAFLAPVDGRISSGHPRTASSSKPALTRSWASSSTSTTARGRFRSSATCRTTAWSRRGRSSRPVRRSRSRATPAIAPARTCTTRSPSTGSRSIQPRGCSPPTASRGSRSTRLTRSATMMTRKRNWPTSATGIWRSWTRRLPRPRRIPSSCASR
jgi:phage-related minor tail protein